MARKRLAVQYPAADPERLEFVTAALEEFAPGRPQDWFDLIICHNTLDYAGKPEAALASLAKLLAPGGLLSLTGGVF